VGARRTTFGKMQRERAKQAKAAAKRERRQERVTDAGTADAEMPAMDTTSDDGLGTLSPAELLKLVEVTHQKFAAGTIGYDEFEETKAELLARLPID
jgi:hypothetical protein